MDVERTVIYVCKGFVGRRDKAISEFKEAFRWNGINADIVNCWHDGTTNTTNFLFDTDRKIPENAVFKMEKDLKNAGKKMGFGCYIDDIYDS